MEEYYTDFKTFHRGRLLSLSNKDSSCLGCTKDRMYKSTTTELVINCGSRGSDKCGDQLRIQLPTYSRFSDETRKIHDTLNGVGYTDDIRDMSRYNLAGLLKVSDFSDDFTEAKEAQEDEHKHLTEELKELTHKYATMNKTKEYSKMIHELYSLRTKISTGKTKLMKRLMTEEDSDKLHEFRVEYAKLGKLEKEEVLPLIHKLAIPFEDYLVLVDPKITKLNDTYLNSEKKKKKTKKKPKKTKKPKNVS